MSEFNEDKPDGAEPTQAPADTPADTAAPLPPVLREDQLQNAVAFLSHPKVRSSSAVSKREFLQRKGLTEAEIDEAFRRVPQQPAAAPAVPAPASTAVASTLQHLQPQQPAQQLSYMQPQQGQLVHAQQPHGMEQQQQQGYGPGAVVLAAPQPQQGVRWTQAALGAGFLAASAYAAKALLWPHVESAYYSWRGQARPPPRPALADGEAEAERSAQATQAMADAIAAQTAELRGSIDAIKQLVTTLEASQKAAADVEAGSSGARAGVEADGLTVADLRQELRSFASTLQELASPKPAGASPAATEGGPARLESELGEIKTLLAELLRSPRSPGSHSPAHLLQGTTADGGGAVTPPSATSIPTLRYTAPAPPGEAAQPLANGFSTPLPAQAQQQQVQPAGEQAPAQSQQSASTPVPAAAAAPSPDAGDAPKPPPHPASYMEVLEMLEKGQTPPGIRTDINDKPPNPSAAPPASKMKPRPKPWERGATTSLAGSLGGAGGSSSSLGSLGGVSTTWATGPAPPASATATGPAEHSASAPAAVLDASPVGAPAAEPSLQQSLSPVRAPSPAQEASASAEAASKDAGQEAQQGSDQGPAAAAGGSLQSPRRAASIYDAVAPAPDSPHIIAGRLSPARSDNLGRSASSNSMGGGNVQPAAGGASASGGTSNFAALLAAAQGRADAGVASARSSIDGPQLPGPLEGSGIGRPISRNWRPPPIPAPTLSGGSIDPPAGSDAAGPSGPGSGPAVEPEATAGMANGDARSPSSASLGQDFSSG